jgi:DNA-binding winged helix-turn-helix (wHTH) protein
VDTAQPELPQPGSFRLGDWLVEPSLNRVSRDDTSVQLELKVMEVLVCLARHAGVVVSKEQIIDTVWQTEFISINTLTHAIGELRRVLGDDARSPRYIETITKRGYRLMVPAVEATTDRPASAGGEPTCAVVVDGHQTFLAPGEHLIGRAPDVTIRIDDHEASRHHARILVADDGAVLEDLGSKNGTRLWGKRLTAPTRLENGDEIAIGPALLVFRKLVTDGTTRTAAEPW